jgi:disulfide bond formation protein DsbB
MKASMERKVTPQIIFGLIGLQGIGIFAGGYILEYVFYYAPCVLCFIQRFLFLFCGLGALGAAIGYKHKLVRYMEAAFSLVAAGLGLALAFYHRNLQLNPTNEVHDCRQDISQMLENFEFGKVIESWLHGDPECQIIQKFMGVNLVEWSILCFALLIVQILYAIKKAG